MVGWLGHLSPHSKKINITQQEQKQEKKNKRKKNQKRTTKNNRKTPIFTLLQGVRSTQSVFIISSYNELSQHYAINSY